MFFLSSVFMCFSCIVFREFLDIFILFCCTAVGWEEQHSGLFMFESTQENDNKINLEFIMVSTNETNGLTTIL